jgi:hypothetical protein
MKYARLKLQREQEILSRVESANGRPPTSKRAALLPSRYLAIIPDMSSTNNSVRRDFRHRPSRDHIWIGGCHSPDDSALVETRVAGLKRYHWDETNRTSFLLAGAGLGVP